MSNYLCIIGGCPGNTRYKKRGEKIYFFKALEDQLEEWSRVIPGGRKLKIHDRICSRHFRDEDLIKEWNFVIEDKTVTMPRGRWTLKVGAVPEKFDNYEDDIRLSLGRKSKPKSLVELGGSSSDSEYEEPRRKRVKKLKKIRSSKAVKKPAKHVPKTPKNGSASPNRPSGPSNENCAKSANQVDEEVSWEKACDNFVDQLSSICAPTPSDKPDAKPVKRRGRPRKEERRRSSLGRPRKDERRSNLGRRKDKWRSKLVSQTLSSHKHSTRLKQKKSFISDTISEMENENSVTVEEFLASGCDGTIDVESLNDPDNSSQITITECIMQSNCTVKTEKDDDGYENCNLVANNCPDSCTIISSSEDSTSRQGQQESAWNNEGVVVKREICDCEGNSRCCEPQLNCEQTVMELPATPVPWEENNQPLDEHVEDRGSISICPETEIDRNGLTEIEMPEVSIIPVSCPDHEVPKSQLAPSEVSCEVTSVPHLDGKELRSQVSAPDTVITESQIEALDLTTTQCSVTRAPTPNHKSGCEELALQRNSPKTDIIVELPEASNTQQPVEKSSDVEIDFQGFSSDEEENLVSRRKHFLKTAEMAEKSSKVYFSKLAKACKSKATTRLPESDGSSARVRRRFKRERRSSAEIAMDQLNELDSMSPVRSKKPANSKGKAVVTDSVRNIRQSSVQDRKVLNINNSLAKRLGPDSKCDDVLKRGRISNEVTVTKASNLNHRLDKVPLVSNLCQGLDKLTTSSNNVLLADKSNIKTNSIAQSSSGGLISNKMSTCDDRLKDKVPTSLSQDLLKNKVTTSLHQYSLKDKVTISSNQELSKNNGTSMAENGLLKEKIPTTTSAPVADRLSHLLYGSSLDRIIESAKGTSLLDSITSTSTSDSTVDKTSQILKNFKTDGVLALECVVLKEQVRQLQKELYLHKQMLIDSEHNVALLQRKLELQAQLPCVKCVNIKRSFIGKETLI